MERKVRAEEPVPVGEITVIPVAEVRLGCRRVNGGLFFSGIKRPWVVLLIANGKARAFTLDGREMPLEEVLAKVPGLGV